MLDENDTPGVTNEALYTNSTLAVDPDTGTLVWHFQHFPNDQWDLDWAFERQIVELPVDGRMRKAVLTSGKIGIYEAVDAYTGEFLFAIDLGLQNIVTEIDARTGEKSVDRSLYPVAVTCCSSVRMARVRKTSCLPRSMRARMCFMRPSTRRAWTSIRCPAAVSAGSRRV